MYVTVVWSNQVLPQQCCIFNYPQTQWVERIHIYFLVPLPAGSLQFVEQGSQLWDSGSRLHEAGVLVLGYRLKIIVYLGHFSLRSGSLESRRACCVMKEHLKPRLDSCILAPQWPKTGMRPIPSQEAKKCTSPNIRPWQMSESKKFQQSREDWEFCCSANVFVCDRQFLVYFLVLFGL